MCYLALSGVDLFVKMKSVVDPGVPNNERCLVRKLMARSTFARDFTLTLNLGKRVSFYGMQHLNS